MEHPNINDTVFLESRGTEYDYASLNRSKGIRNEKPMFHIIEGYREAAFLLLNELINNHNYDWLKIDSLIYPLLYSFRHYLEVIMKDTLRYHRMIRRETYSDQVGFQNEHSLIEVWADLKPYLRNTYSDSWDLEEHMKAVEKLLTEIDEKDKGSFSFRYPYKSANRKDTSVQFSLPKSRLT